MQQVDPAFLFEVGDSSRSVKRLTENGDKIQQWLLLNSTLDSIDSCVFQSVYKENFHNPLFIAANNLKSEINKKMVSIFPSEGDGQPLSDWDIKGIQSLYAKYDTILISELQSLSSYLVTRKSGFNTELLINSGILFFPSNLINKAPDAIPDLEQAMKCIAFELPTAAGFHLHRANESVLRYYWDSITSGKPKPNNGNMGIYIDELRKNNYGPKKIVEHLKSIKDFHRNPLMHPDQSLNSVDEAIDLMSAIRCSIGYMLQHISEPDNPIE